MYVLVSPVRRGCSQRQRAAGARVGYVGKDGLCRQGLDCVQRNPKGLPRPRQEVVLSTSKVEKYKVAVRFQRKERKLISAIIYLGLSVFRFNFMYECLPVYVHYVSAWRSERSAGVKEA